MLNKSISPAPRLDRAAEIKRLLKMSIIGLGITFLFGASAYAQSFSLDLGEGGTLSARVVQLILFMTVISLAPGILVMMTSFTRLLIVFSILRSAMGTQSTPPNMVITSLALFLTAYIMAPTFTTAYEQGIKPMINEEIDEVEGLQRAVQPVKGFMVGQTRDEDLLLFYDLAGEELPATAEEADLTKLIPAFIISELRRAFEIAFLIYLPFIVIDMTVASVLMSMGMMMLPPVMIALPFKIIFFVLVDGWRLIVGALVQSFGASSVPITGG